MRYRYAAGKNGKPIKRALVYTRDEHGIDFADVDGEAVSIVRRLKDAGYESYIVGGAVRDLIMGRKPKDFDIASEASPAKIKKLFRNSRIIGRRFRLVHVYFGQRIFEVSTFRSLRDGPTSNTFGTIEEDVLRRDFTMNALFYDPAQQIVVDYVGGMKDIRSKRVRPIIPLSMIFRDDPVRMIRAVKYAAAAEFDLPFMVKWKIKRQSFLLAEVSPSRLTEEIFKIIRSSRADRIVEALDNMGLYRYLQPGAVRLMRKKAGFRARYLGSMAALNKEGFRDLPGEAIGALINDYLEDITDWGQGVADNYKAAFAAARSFVLPMNPPRFELDYAVRRFFAAHGVMIKKSYIMERSRPPARKDAEEHEGRAGSGTRRRRKSPADQGSAD
jgi:poly(A) polymerase